MIDQVTDLFAVILIEWIGVVLRKPRSMADHRFC